MTRQHWPDCAMNHGGAACDMGPDCGTKTKEQIAQKAAELWASFDKNERFGVPFGLFPFAKMEAAEKDGFKDYHRELAVALMDRAKATK